MSIESETFVTASTPAEFNESALIAIETLMARWVPLQDESNELSDQLAELFIPIVPNRTLFEQDYIAIWVKYIIRKYLRPDLQNILAMTDPNIPTAEKDRLVPDWNNKRKNIRRKITKLYGVLGDAIYGSKQLPAGLKMPDKLKRASTTPSSTPSTTPSKPISIYLIISLLMCVSVI
jgi:hypothetical protein